MREVSCLAVYLVTSSKNSTDCVYPSELLISRALFI